MVCAAHRPMPSDSVSLEDCRKQVLRGGTVQQAVRQRLRKPQASSAVTTGRQVTPREGMEAVTLNTPRPI